MLKKFFQQPKKNILPIINFILIILVAVGGVFYLGKKKEYSFVSQEEFTQLKEEYKSFRMNTNDEINKIASNLQNITKDFQRRIDIINIRTDYVIDPETGWKIYENMKHRYKVKIPQNWYIYSNPGKDYYLNRVSFSNYSRFYDAPWSLDKPYIGIQIIVTDDESKNFEEFKQKININPESTIELKEVEINNRPAIKRVLENPITGQPSVSVHFLHNKKHYSLGYSLYNNEEFNKILEQAVSSFKFIE